MSRAGGVVAVVSGCGLKAKPWATPLQHPLVRIAGFGAATGRVWCRPCRLASEIYCTAPFAQFAAIQQGRELGCFRAAIRATGAPLNVAIDGYWAALALPLSPNSLTKPGCMSKSRMPAPLADLRNRNMTIGTVKFFNADKGYGFIAPEDGGSDARVIPRFVNRL